MRSSDVCICALFAIPIFLVIIAGVAWYDETTLTVQTPVRRRENIVKPTIVLGMMVSDQTSLRAIEAHRRSFRNFTKKGNSSCDIKLFFFFGESDVKSSVNGHDVVRGNFKENLNDGKTFEWFKWAVAWFGKHRPNADPRSMIIKFDCDTAVKWSRLDKLVPTFNSSVYFGLLADCGSGPWCPPHRCFKEQAKFAGDCWIYMSGGFYGLSLGVARQVMNCSFPANNKVGHEDLTVGRWIKNCNVSVQVYSVEMNRIFCHERFMLKRFTLEDVQVCLDESP